MVLDAITAHPHQRKMTFDAFMELTIVLQDEKNLSLIETLKVSLEDANICQWAEMIE